MKKIRVGMDISQIAHPGGVATYTQNLAENLSKNPDLEMVYFFSSLRKKVPLFIHGNVKKYKLPPTLFEMLFNRWRNVSIEKFLGPLDIFHSSDWTQPPTKAKKVTTYHDVIPLKYPTWSQPKIVAVHKRRLKIVEREIDMVIAVSESTKRDLMEVSKIPEEKITVIYEAAGSQFKTYPKSEVENFRKKMGLPNRFVLAMSGVGDRRNLARVKEVSKDYDLIIAGETIPYIEKDEFPLMYCAADVLLYPSFYEGFGIPILEAMGCGVPVITSNVSSMPEVGGEAGLYVDPTNTEDIKKTLKNVMGDKDLRVTMIKKGFEQVKRFSWEKAAEQTADIYRRLMR